MFTVDELIERIRRREWSPLRDRREAEAWRFEQMAIIESSHDCAELPGVDKEKI